MNVMPSRMGEAAAAAPGSGAEGRVFVAPARTDVDTVELHAAATVLVDAADRLLLAHGAAEDVRHEIVLWDPEAGAAAAARAEALGADLLRLRADTQALAEHLDRARLMYEETEHHLAAVFQPTLLRHLRATVPRLYLPGGLFVPLSPEVLAGATGVAVTAARQAHDSRAALTQRAVRGAADDLQHAFPYWTGRPVVVDGQTIDPVTLTPVQRVALGLVPAARTLGAVRGAGRGPGGGTRPARVSPVPPSWSTVTGRLTDADLLRRTAAVADRSRSAKAAVLEVLRTTTPGGGRRWTVLVPGTQDLLVGGPSPLDNLTNLEAMAGLPTAVETGVTSALDQAGVAPGEAVMLVGHSQGGMVAARLAADPVFTARYDVRAVLTAGGPVGGIAVPADVAVLSLEEIEDPVVGLDGLANRAGDNHVTVVADTRGLPGVGHPHDLSSYTAAAELLEHAEDPALERWHARTALPAGGHTEALAFEVTR